MAYLPEPDENVRRAHQSALDSLDLAVDVSQKLCELKAHIAAPDFSQLQAARPKRHTMFAVLGVLAAAVGALLVLQADLERRILVALLIALALASTSYLLHLRHRRLVEARQRNASYNLTTVPASLQHDLVDIFPSLVEYAKSSLDWSRGNSIGLRAGANDGARERLAKRIVADTYLMVVSECARGRSFSSGSLENWLQVQVLHRVMIELRAEALVAETPLLPAWVQGNP